MLSVTDAAQCVLEHASRIHPREQLTWPTSQGHSFVIEQAIFADRAFPPFDRVAMDGIAMKFASWQAGNRAFALQGIQAAGQPPMTLELADGAIEVMTGATLPLGTDTVIRYEDLSLSEDSVQILPNVSIIQGQNIHRRGQDRREGDLLIRSGNRLLAPHWAVLASVGQEHVRVKSTPRVALIGTGDELVDIGAAPKDHQIRVSNVYAMAAGLRDYGFHDLSLSLVRDDLKLLESVMQKALTDADVVVLSGAVSAGKFDHVPFVLKNLQVREVFHQVAQRPGKPLWFGSTDRNLVFGLPGNPVSALLSCYRYVLPALVFMTGSGRAGGNIFAQLAESATFNLGEKLTHFTPVRVLFGSDGVLRAKPTTPVGSGDLAGLLESDGFVECPAGRKLYQAGEPLRLFPWRPL